MELTNDQKKCKEVFNSFDWAKHDNIFVLRGSGGTGKSFTSRYLVSKTGRVPKASVLGIALSHAARINLQQSIPTSKTYAAVSGKSMKFSQDDDNPLAVTFVEREGFIPQDMEKVRWVVIDEISQLLLSDINRIKDMVNPNVKFLLLGDYCQLPPIGVEDDRDSELFDLAGFTLTECVRQKEGDAILDLANYTRDLIVNNGKIYNLKRNVPLTSIKGGKGYAFTSRQKSIESLANAIKDGQDAISVTYRNKTRMELNRDVRNLVHGGDKHQFVEGDMIIATNQYTHHKNLMWQKTSSGWMYISTKDPLLYNGDRARVLEVKEKKLPKSRCLSTYHSQEYMMSWRYVNDLKRIYNELVGSGFDTWELKLNIIDEPIYVLKEEEKQRFAQVRAELTKLSKIHDNLGIVNQFTSKFADIKYSYAVTIYSAQGSSIDKVYCDFTDIMACSKLSNKRRLQAAYVGFSRARNNLAVF